MKTIPTRPNGSEALLQTEESQQAKLTHAASRMFAPPILPDLHSIIFSQGSADGLSPWPLPDGRQVDPRSLALALANLSAAQVKELGLATSGIYGPPGCTSSDSANLASSLASKLMQALELDGGI